MTTAIIKNTTLYSVIAWKEGDYCASVHLDEHFKTLSGAIRHCERHPEYRTATIREEHIVLRTEDTEISSSSPIINFEHGIRKDGV